MKTIEIKILTFEELSQEAKETAIQQFRERQQHDFIYEDARATVEAFNKVFNIEEGRRSWLDYSISHIEDNILELSGIRLRTYIINNFYNDIFKPKFIKSLKNTEARHRNVKNKTYKNGNKSAFYYSAINVSIDGCPLTGMCYDYDMLKPIYEFLEFKDIEKCKNTTFADLIEDCFYTIKKTIENEIEYRESDEGIIEEIESQNLEFTEDGKRY